MSEPKEERNIEIKARILDDQDFDRRINIGRKLTGAKEELIVQRDVFFKSQKGRFKLRYLEEPARAQLVYYDRPDVSGPKLSKYNKIDVDDPETLELMLRQSNGALGEISKKRYLFVHENTRIHIDRVENLGNFMEFEVCLKPEDTVEEGQAKAKELMELFRIDEDALMTGAYFDELYRKDGAN